MPDLTKLDLTILYTEDDETAREEICQILRRRYRTVIAAANGSIGLQLFREQSPDLVITDIRMPIMDGLEMTREIRKLDPEVQIIVTTAHNDVSYLLQAIDIGVDNYVLKPLETDKLLAALVKSAAIIQMKKEALRHQEEREKLLAELQEAMSKVKLLSGMLPICSACKKIRDDRGYWQQIEKYIKDHSQAEFTHGICPECAKRLYPELYGDPK